MNDYFTFYGLEFDPFLKNSKDILLETAESAEAKTRFGYMAGARGFGVLTGAPGLGKTTVTREWAASLNPSLYRVSYNSLSSLTVMDFYRQIAASLGAQPGFRKNDIFNDIQREIRRYSIEKRITPVIIIDEADMLNVALFGMTAAQWRAQNPGRKGNIRDHATLQQLLVLANMESYNALLIEQKQPQHERIRALRQMAVKQLRTLASIDMTNLPQLPERTE